MKLYCDTREPRKQVRKAKKVGFEPIDKELDVGDYIYKPGGLVFERKTISDFISSIRNGHLQKQLLQMDKNFEETYLILVGDVNDMFRSGRTQLTVNQWIGSLASIIVRYDSSLVQVKNELRAMKIMYKICDKTADDKNISLQDTELLKQDYDLDDLRLKILTCFNQVGPKRAQKHIKDDEIATKVDELIEAMT